MVAIRVARAATGRSFIVKFEALPGGEHQTC
jgi:glutamate-1-semialdehyde aminotransferase